MSDLEQEQNIEKYRELYEYSRDMHFKQLERRAEVNQKAAMFLSVLTVLIGLVGFFLKTTIDEAIPPREFLDWALFLAAILSGTTVLISWFSFLFVLRVRDRANLRLDKKLLDFFQTSRRIDIHYAISKRASEAFADNDVHLAAKARWMSCGYLFTIVTVLILTVSLFIFGCMMWNNSEPALDNTANKLSLTDSKKEGGKNMPERTQDNAEDQTPIDQPNTSVEAPANIVQRESVDYSEIRSDDAGQSEDKEQ